MTRRSRERRNPQNRNRRKQVNEFRNNRAIVPVSSSLIIEETLDQITTPTDPDDPTTPPSNSTIIYDDAYNEGQSAAGNTLTTQWGHLLLARSTVSGGGSPDLLGEPFWQEPGTPVTASSTEKIRTVAQTRVNNEKGGFVSKVRFYVQSGQKYAVRMGYEEEANASIANTRYIAWFTAGSTGWYEVDVPTFDLIIEGSVYFELITYSDTITTTVSEPWRVDNYQQGVPPSGFVWYSGGKNISISHLDDNNVDRSAFLTGLGLGDKFGDYSFITSAQHFGSYSYFEIDPAGDGFSGDFAGFSIVQVTINEVTAVSLTYPTTVAGDYQIQEHGGFNTWQFLGVS